MDIAGLCMTTSTLSDFRSGLPCQKWCWNYIFTNKVIYWTMILVLLHKQVRGKHPPYPTKKTCNGDSYRSRPFQHTSIACRLWNRSIMLYVFLYSYVSNDDPNMWGRTGVGGPGVRGSGPLPQIWGLHRYQTSTQSNIDLFLWFARAYVILTD